MQVRPYREDDRDAVIALWGACDLLRPWNDPVADIDLCVRNPTSALFVAQRDGAPLAGAVMAGGDGHRGWIYYLATDPAHRRAGIGRALVRHAEDWLGEQGVGKVNLMIRAEHGAVRAFYESVGYAVEERVVMARRLGASGARAR